MRSIDTWQRPTFSLKQVGGELVKEPFEVNIVEEVLAAAAAA